MDPRIENLRSEAAEMIGKAERCVDTDDGKELKAIYMLAAKYLERLAVRIKARERVERNMRRAEAMLEDDNE